MDRRQPGLHVRWRVHAGDTAHRRADEDLRVHQPVGQGLGQPGARPRQALAVLDAVDPGLERAFHRCEPVGVRRHREPVAVGLVHHGPHLVGGELARRGRRCPASRCRR